MHYCMMANPAQSSATVTADSAPVDLFTASLPYWARSHEEKPHTVIFFNISHWHAMSEEEVNSDSGREQAEDVRHIGAKMESPQSMAQMPNEMATSATKSMRHHVISIPGGFAIVQEGSIGDCDRWWEKTETLAFCLSSLQVLVSVTHPMYISITSP
ncbi:hypothetical protein BDR07DRAFT_1373199 [Suillus spraguei]|nr:hypothetical protein BDR07DRAFT_1373199 [Suillus spraguei]